MREVKLSTKNQIVIPREIRDAWCKAGDRLLVARYISHWNGSLLR
jgi:bifunctional DNA-binding transcriptional regulator/antitoxin component of YhaV-PrlF toxin-antitoxin module